MKARIPLPGVGLPWEHFDQVDFCQFAHNMSVNEDALLGLHLRYVCVGVRVKSLRNVKIMPSGTYFYSVCFISVLQVGGIIVAFTIQNVISSSLEAKR